MSQNPTPYIWLMEGPSRVFLPILFYELNVTTIIKSYHSWYLGVHYLILILHQF